MISELEGTLLGLDHEKSYDLMDVKLHGDRLFFMSRIFNHDFYDSLVSSGKINFVDRSIQQPIQDVYHHIRDHNTYLQKIRDLENETDDVTQVERYYKLLDHIELVLKSTIPPAIEKLRGVA